MAIASISMGFISRSQGQSSVGSSAYISGSQSHDLRTGDTYNYSSKKELICSKILAPEDAPDWATNAHTLWNNVEAFEDERAAELYAGHPTNDEKHARSLAAREKLISSAQTAQTIMCALPRELTTEQQEELVEGFLKDRFVSRKLVLQYAIHDQNNNPHFHANITRRALIDGQFSYHKDREIVSKQELIKTRLLWAEHTNRALEKAGHEVRIDARSLADQGSLLIPSQHEGWYARNLVNEDQYSRIVHQNEEIRQRNIEIMCEQPEAIIHEVALKRTTFTRKHIEDEIIRRVGGDEKLFEILRARVQGVDLPREMILNEANSNVVYQGFAGELQLLAAKLTDQLLSNHDVTMHVGENFDRKKVYTSTEYHTQEQAITELADKLAESSSKSISQDRIYTGIRELEEKLAAERGETFTFSKEQSTAIHHLCSGPDLRVLNGKAGTGKTTLLKAVADIYQEAGYRVLGTSFQGKAVEVMEQEIGIPCRTLDSFNYHWKKHAEKKELVDSGRIWGMPYIYAFNRMKVLEQYKFSSRDVILVDEANMIGGNLWQSFLNEATAAGAKVLVIQDPAQIKSRDPGDFGRLIADRFGFAETNQVVRQRVEWQAQCSVAFNEHRVVDGLQPYQEKGYIHWHESQIQVHNQLVYDYMLRRNQAPDQSRMALAYQNKDVEALNQAIRAELKFQGALKEHFSVHGIEYSLGDTIRFTKNDNHGRYVKNLDREDQVGVKNGSIGIITGFNGRALQVELQSRRQVQFKVGDYKDFTLGYAMSIHKSEGSTFDESLVVADPRMDPHTLLVAMSRHRHGVQLYVSHEQFVDFKELVESISWGDSKQVIQDYNVRDEDKPYANNVFRFKDLLVETSNLRDQIEHRAGQKQCPQNDGLFQAYESCYEAREALAQEILVDWKKHQPFVRVAGLRRDVLEVEAGLRPKLLSDLEHRASVCVEGYMDQVRQCRTLWNGIKETHPGSLAQDHGRYTEYASQRTERNYLASVIRENPRMYRQFFEFKEIGKQGEEKLYKDFWGNTVTGSGLVFFGNVKAHADGHKKEHARETYYNSLSDEDKKIFDLAQTYTGMRNRAATLYNQLKTASESAIQGTATVSHIQDELRNFQAKRDTHALQLSSRSRPLQPFLDYFKIDEVKMLHHATSGQTRELLNTYIDARDVPTRGETANKLLFNASRPTDKRLIKEAGIEFSKLQFDVAFHQGVQNGTIDASVNPDDVYISIKNYLHPAREVARIWNMVTTKGAEATHLTPMELMNQSPHKQEWLQMIRIRNDNAQQLVETQVGMVVLKGMRPELVETVYKRAEKAQSRLVAIKEHGPHTSRPQATKDENFQARTTFSQVRSGFIDVNTVLHMAKDRYQDLVPQILNRAPDVKKSNKSQLSFGSLKFTISGSRAGQWYDFATQKGGNIISLVAEAKGLEFKDALKELASDLNISSYDPIHYKPDRSSKDNCQEEEALKQAKLQTVGDLYQRSKPMEGTVVEKYLRETRHIKTGFSQDLRCIPKGTQFEYAGKLRTVHNNCFAAFGRQSDGSLSVVQLTQIAPDGTRAIDKDGDKINKLQYGVSKGAFVTIQDGQGSNRTFIAEGLETALSIKEAGVNEKIVAALGIHNISNYQGPEQSIIICADNDDHKPNSQTYKIIEKTVESFKANNILVDVIKPSTPGQDFNDLLKEQGAKGVAEYVKQYTEDTSSIQASPSVAETKPSHDEDSKIRMNDTLLGRTVLSVDELFKDLKSTTDPVMKENLLDKLDEKMKLLAKDPTIIQSIKAINEPVGAKLEEIHQKLQEHERLKHRNCGMEM